MQAQTAYSPTGPGRAGFLRDRGLPGFLGARAQADLQADFQADFQAPGHVPGRAAYQSLAGVLALPLKGIKAVFLPVLLTVFLAGFLTGCSDDDHDKDLPIAAWKTYCLGDSVPSAGDYFTITTQTATLFCVEDTLADDLVYIFAGTEVADEDLDLFQVALAVGNTEGFSAKLLALEIGLNKGQTPESGTDYIPQMTPPRFLGGELNNYSYDPATGEGQPQQSYLISGGVLNLTASDFSTVVSGYYSMDLVDPEKTSETFTLSGEFRATPKSP